MRLPFGLAATAAAALYAVAAAAQTVPSTESPASMVAAGLPATAALASQPATSAAFDLPPAVLADQLTQLRQVLQGGLPANANLTALLRVDLADSAACAERAAALETILASLPLPASSTGTTMPASPGALSEAPATPAPESAAHIPVAELVGHPFRLRAAVIDAALRVLRRPPPERLALVQLEADYLRAREAHRQAEQAQRDAEAARERALAEAAHAVEEGRRTLAKERVRAESWRIQIANQRSAIAIWQQALIENAHEDARRLAELERHVRTADPGSPAANDLFDSIVLESYMARASLWRALEATRTPFRVPEFLPDRGGRRGLGAGLQAEAAALDGMIEMFRREALAVEREAAASLAERVEFAFLHLIALNQVRLTLLPQLPEAKRRAVLGFGTEGRSQAWREAEHLRVLSSYYWYERRALLARLYAWTRDAAAMGIVLPETALVAFAAALARWAARRRENALRRLRLLAARSLGRSWTFAFTDFFIEALHALGGELLFTALAAAIPHLAAGFASHPAGAVLSTGFWAYALYRLGVQASLHLLSVAAETPVAQYSLTYGPLTLRTLRIAGRYALAVAIWLITAQAVLGRGYLYALVRDVSWLGAVPIVFVWINLWRPSITSAYLGFRQTGELARLVAATRDRWYGFFVTIAAFGILFVSWTSRRGQAFVLSFEQSRKALAYVFRRRLERQAAAHEPNLDPKALPTDLQAALTMAPVAGAPHTWDHFPGLEDFSATVRAWHAHPHGGGTYLVTGRLGAGKTTWLRAAAGRWEAAASGLAPETGAAPLSHATYLGLDHRVAGADALVRHLTAGLALPAETPLTPAGAIAAICHGPRRLVVLDDIHNLFLRTPGGFAAWNAFEEIAAGTAAHAFWLCAMAHYPAEYLAWARRGLAVFRHITDLAPWTEQDIASLLRTRLAATNYDFIYDDLLTAGDRLEGFDDRLISTQDEYFRLIWDYADGSPRVALRAFAHSLARDASPHRFRVRLFPRVSGGQLENLSENEKFALASVAWHENLSPAEAALTLGRKTFDCHISLLRLAEAGILDERNGRFRVTAAWWPEAAAYLRRKHLISS